MLKNTFIISVLIVAFFACQISPQGATLTGPPSFGIISGMGFKIKASAPRDTTYFQYSGMTIRKNGNALKFVATGGDISGKLDKAAHSQYSAAHRAAYQEAFTPYTSTRTWTNVQTAITETNRDASTNLNNHTNSIIPYGGHPPAGSNRQLQYNNNGTAGGTAYLSYTASALQHRPSERYAKTNITRTETGAISSYMIGHGVLVIGSPYTDAFTASGFYPTSGTSSAFNTTRLIWISLNHTIDFATVTKGSTVIFTNFTAMEAVGINTWTPRRTVTTGTDLRVRYTTGVKDTDGNPLYQNYSAHWTAL